MSKPMKVIYAEQTEFESHAFRSTESAVLKYDQVAKKPYEKTHAHVFHTRDSSGKLQETTNHVGGHFHKVKVTDHGPGMVPTIECGPPMKMSKVKKGNSYKTIMIPYYDRDGIKDEHTHQFGNEQYRGTQRVKPRSPNIEAAKFLNQETAKVQKKTEPIKGIEGEA
jgi:hypothetical protein